jgi:hypothetical protein
VLAKPAVEPAAHAGTENGRRDDRKKEDRNERICRRNQRARYCRV